MFELNWDFTGMYVLLIAGSILAFCFLVQMVYYLYFYRGILAYRQKIRKHDVPFRDDKPSVSVIICAKNESENLDNFLPSVLNQDYPNFEVIVINDGSTDETEMVMKKYEKKYRNLYHTYVPENAQIMCSKKLALTLGIKAAKNDLLLFIDADCAPISEHWIEKMTRNFTTGKDFVLGYGAYEQKSGVLSHLISYDTFFIALQYMGFALRGLPYMGVGRNLGYRKDVFFKNKGFESILHLQSGDDDLFVNKNAKGSTTRVEINPLSVTSSVPEETFKDWYIQKERHLSTSHYYKTSTRTLIGTEVFTRGLFYLSFLISLLAVLFTNPFDIGMKNWIWSISIVGGLFLLRYIVQALIINLSASILGERKFFLSILVFDILLPLISLRALTVNKLRHTPKYKWK